MNTHKILRKFARRLHRSFFQSVPNDAPAHVDLSKLRPAQYGLEMQMQFPAQSAMNANHSSGLPSAPRKPGIAPANPPGFSEPTNPPGFSEPSTRGSR